MTSEATKRQIELHGIDAVRAKWAKWDRKRRDRIRGGPPKPRAPSVQASADATQAALNATKGDQGKAAKLLGITKVPMWTRINRCIVPCDGGTETLRTWLDRTWPQRDPRYVEVVAVTYERHEIVGHPRWRVYSLAAHRGVEAGAHVNRVPEGGRERQRVECQRCKEARTT